MHPMTIKKEELKKLAKEIREAKQLRKGIHIKPEKERWQILGSIWRNKRKFRHEHIAYCLVRGRTYEQIETPREDNKPDMKLVEKLKDELQIKVDEANAEWEKLHPKKVINE